MTHFALTLGRTLLVALLVWPAVSQAQLVSVSDVLIEGKGWESLADDFTHVDDLAADRSGHLFISDSAQSKIFRSDPTGKTAVWVAESHGTRGIAVGADGRLYACESQTGDIVAYDGSGKRTVIAKGIHGDDLLVTALGGLYISQAQDRKLWYVSPDGARRVVFRGLRQASGIALWPDGSTFILADGDIAYLWTFRVAADGSLRARQPFSTLRTTIDGGGRRPSGVTRMTVDASHHLFATSSEGLQFFDKEGRLSGVILRPRGVTLSSVVFGGPERQVLYVASRTTVYRRLTQGAKK